MAWHLVRQMGEGGERCSGVGGIPICYLNQVGQRLIRVLLASRADVEVAENGEIALELTDLEAAKREITRLRRSLAELEPSKDTVLLAGIVVPTRTQMTRRGKMAIVTLEDLEGIVEVVVVAGGVGRVFEIEPRRHAPLRQVHDVRPRAQGTHVARHHQATAHVHEIEVCRRP